MGRATLTGLVLAAAAALLAPGRALAQAAVRASTSVQPSVPAARTNFRLVVTLEGARSVESPTMPAVKGLTLVSGPQVGTNRMNLNGAWSYSVSLTWVASVQEPGDYTIPAIRFVADGSAVETAPVAFRARAPGPQDPVTDPAALQEKYKDSLFVTAEVTKAAPYVGEPIVLTFRLWIGTDAISNYRGMESPPIGGFLQEKLGDERRYRRTMPGGKYFIVIERSTLLIPIEAGDRSIAPVEAAIDVRVQSGRRRNPFGDSIFDDLGFGGLDDVTAPLALRSEPIAVSVKPLPADGRPPLFAGAVGQFDLNANVSHREVAAGDPVTVKIQLRGRGNFRNMGPPGFAAPLAGFREYEPERKENVEATEQGLFGTVDWTRAIVPEKPGATEIPKIVFPYFDVESGSYKTLESGPFPLVVTEAKGPARPLVSERAGGGESGAGGGKAIRFLREDVLPLLPPPADLAPRRSPQPALLAVAALAPLASLAATALLARKRERFRLDPAARRREFAYKTALGRLAEDAGPDGVARAVSGFIADRLSRPAASVTPAEVPALLEGKGDVAAAARDLLEECDRLRFARGAASDSGDLARRAAELLRKLKEALR